MARTMSLGSDLQSLQSFVRHTIGCGCPVEVLESIEYQEGLTGPDCSYDRLDVGGRLLVLVVSDPPDANVKTIVQGLLRLGLAERDRLGFNRLRLVTAGSNPEALTSEAEAAFAACDLPDDRVHLHVLSSAALSAASDR
jgi:hypothetical protein